MTENENSAAPNFNRRKIGNTTYRVSVTFSGTSKENIGDKILRVAENDLNFRGLSSAINIPQTGQLLKGMSL